MAGNSGGNWPTHATFLRDLAMKIESLCHAEERLYEWMEKQADRGVYYPYPASGSTVETERGWVFYNCNGRVATVYRNGRVR